MSTPEQATIKCDQCGLEQEFTMWASLNVTLDADLKRKFLSGELMHFRCKQCGWNAPVEYPFLYHDMDQHFMISTAAQQPDLSHPGNDMLRRMAQAYRLRFVASRNEALEKVLIFDAGLNDREIEYVKLKLRPRLEPEKYQSLAYPLRFVRILESAAEGDNLEFIIKDDVETVAFLLPRSDADSLIAEAKSKLPVEEIGTWQRVNPETIQVLLNPPPPPPQPPPKKHKRRTPTFWRPHLTTEQIPLVEWLLNWRCTRVTEGDSVNVLGIILREGKTSGVVYQMGSIQESIKLAQQEILKDGTIEFYALAFPYQKQDDDQTPVDGLMVAMERKGLLSTLFVFFPFERSAETGTLGVKESFACERTDQPLLQVNREYNLNSLRQLGLGTLVDMNPT